jgi:nicotinamide-nucleotide amidase
MQAPADALEPAIDHVATLIAALAERGLTVAVAESLTGGLVVAELTRVPGSSAVVRGGVVAYATDLKNELLGVDATLLAEVGPVHAAVAGQMASGVAARLGATIGLSTTGVAGPDAQGGQPVGTVFVGLAVAGHVTTHALAFTGSRQNIRRQSVDAALELLVEALETLTQP